MERERWRCWDFLTRSDLVQRRIESHSTKCSAEQFSSSSGHSLSGIAESLVGRLFPNHVFRIFVFSQAQKDRVPQVILLGPFTHYPGSMLATERKNSEFAIV
jgi:hypothetical protein